MPKTLDTVSDPMLEFPGYLLRRASMSTLAELNRRLSQFDLRHGDFSLLQMINANPGIKQTKACQLLDIKRANMVPLIAKMEDRNLISRTAIDGRSQAIRLTAAGRALAKKTFLVAEAYEKELIEQVPESLREAVMPVLQSLWKGDTKDAVPKPPVVRRRRVKKLKSNKAKLNSM